MSDNEEREGASPDAREEGPIEEPRETGHQPGSIVTPGASADAAKGEDQPPEEAPGEPVPLDEMAWDFRPIEERGTAPEPPPAAAPEPRPAGRTPDAPPPVPPAHGGAMPGVGSVPPPGPAGVPPGTPPPPGAQRYAQRPGAGAPPRASRPAWLPWVAGGCGGCLLWAILLVAFGLVSGFGGRPSSPLPAGDRIGLIYVEGPIMGGRGAASFFGISGGSDIIVRQLDRARRDRSIKAVVLRINSPGGSAAASQEIYQEVMRLRQARKPVIASMGDVAASGGYYVASAADKIMANGSTMTGSIGVIMEFMNLQGLYEKVGLGSVTIKSGKYKDIGSSSRPLTQEERTLLQAMIDDVYDQFITDVVAGRKGISREHVRRVADGRIFTGRQAQKLKLVDELGNMQDAITLAAKTAGITGRPTVVEVGRRSFLDMFLGDDSGLDGRMRLPTSSGEDERVLRALRQYLQQQALPR